jgi:hypothetical protein
MRFEELLPQVENYNRALEHMHATAEWCKVVQADDWIRERCLARMVEVGGLDARIGLVASYYLRGNEVRGYGLPIDQNVFDGQSACRAQLRQQFYFMGSPTTLMYRASVVRSRRPFYALNRFHEDTEAAYDILEYSHLGFVPEILSGIRVGNPSIMESLASSHVDIGLAHTLAAVEHFGDRFLPRKESQQRKRVAKVGYFLFLGKSAFKMRPKEFWDYQKSTLEELGWRWSWTRVFFWAFLASLTWLLNPLSTATKMARYFRTG